MGWTSSNTRHKVAMTRLWNRLTLMDENRITKIVFNWDSKFNNSWSSQMRSLLTEINMQDIFTSRSTISTNLVWALLHEKNCDKWCRDIYNKPKLRTYVTFKEKYEVEKYVLSLMSRRQHSVLAQLRCGILPIEIETGRWNRVDYNLRFCKLCNDREVENEEHFIFSCNVFINERTAFFNTVENISPGFAQNNVQERFTKLMTKELVVQLSKYLLDIYNKRREKLFT